MMLDIIFIIYIFGVGLLLGSFFNVCIYRIPREESVVFPPSHCTTCSNRLKALDLIPVISYLFLKGRCRYCGEKISPRYALIELMTGVIFTAIYLKYGLTFIFIKYTALASFLIVIGMIDYDTTDVYTKTTLLGIIVGIIFTIIGYYFGYELKSYILGGIAGGGAIALIILLTGGMGWGDVEICLLSGLYLGLVNTILFLFLSFLIGGVIGGVLIVTKVKSRKDYIPFGPSIALAALITIIFGENIISWYLNLMQI